MVDFPNAFVQSCAESFINAMGLDTVELVIRWETIFALPISNEEAVKMETPRKAVDFLCTQLAAEDSPGPCPTVKAFKHLRAALKALAPASLQKITLDTPLRRFHGTAGKQAFWAALARHPGLHWLQAPGFFSGISTVRDLLEELVTTGVNHLRGEGQPWTRALIRNAVRGTTRPYAARRFRDDDHFCRDIGLA